MDQAINTFPPLISSNSIDRQGRAHIIGDGVAKTLTIEQIDSDPFFIPDDNFTGYAYDGTYYENGVQNKVTTAFNLSKIKLSKNIISWLGLEDNRILFIEDFSGSSNTSGIFNTYNGKQEYSDINFINNYPEKLSVGPTMIINKKGTIVSFGGTLKSGSKVTSIVGFNQETNQWFKYGSSFVEELSEFMLYPLADGTILLTGGYDGLKANKFTYIFDPMLDRLSVLEIPVYRTQSIIWESYGKLWVIGGQNTNSKINSTADILFLDLDIGLCSVSGLSLVGTNGLYKCQGNEYDGKLYIWGGHDAVSSKISSKLFILGSNGVDAIPITNVRYDYNSTITDNYILIFSGRDQVGSVVPNCIEYDIINKTEKIIGAITPTIHKEDVIGPINTKYYILSSGEIDIVSWSEKEVPVYSSWYLEKPSEHRGILKQFPHMSLVLFNNECISILDQGQRLDLWMKLVIGSHLAYRTTLDNVSGVLEPLSISYSRGVISCVYKIVGSNTGIYTLIVDLAKDQISVEYVVTTGAYQ
jgi:hypothetical protein